MFRTLESLGGSLEKTFAADENFEKEVDQRCNLKGETRLLTAEGCKSAVECFEKMSSSLRSREILQTQIDEVFRFLRKSKYGAEFTVPRIPDVMMKRPEYSVPTQWSLYERMVGAFSDIYEGLATTIIALVLAIIIDMMVLMLGFIRSVEGQKARNSIPDHPVREHAAGERERSEADIELAIREYNAARRTQSRDD